ncbi:hypothetical protein VCHE16_0007, partial [Vibrio paracholerae HE-16]
MIATAQII